MKNRFEVKQQENGKFQVIDNESQFKTVLDNGEIIQSKWIALDMTKQDAEKLAERKNFRVAWGK